MRRCKMAFFFSSDDVDDQILVYSHLLQITQSLLKALSLDLPLLVVYWWIQRNEDKWEEDVKTK